MGKRVGHVQRIIHATRHMSVVVAGVAGSGKSTVGRALSERLDARFVDGDTP